MARSFLEMEGIDAIVAADDAGGMEPGIMSPARVIVREEDAVEALAILSRQKPPEADDETGSEKLS